MQGRRTKIAAAVAAVATVVALTLPMTAANAADQELEFTNTAGLVAIGSLPAIAIPAGDAGIAGTWDDVTGDFTGSTQFNPISIAANPPSVPVDVVVTLGNNGADNVAGTIDPTTGALSLTASMILTIEVPVLGATCSSSAFDVDFVDGEPFGPLPFDPQEDYSVAVDGVFTIPAFLVANCALADAINAAIGLPADGGMSLDLVRGVPAPPTTPTTSSTVPGNLINCDPNVPQAEEQAILDEDPSDPNDLDRDNDGIACDEDAATSPRFTG